jgi:hypothetical protein
METLDLIKPKDIFHKLIINKMIPVPININMRHIKKIEIVQSFHLENNKNSLKPENN